MGPGTEISGPARLYNSRILRVYLEYLATHHPGVDTDALLGHTGLDRALVEDPAVWVTQPQVDRFHAWLVENLDEPDIARKAGRFGASSAGMGMVRQLVLSLVDPGQAYLLMGRLYPLMSRGAKVRARRVGRAAVEITSVPAPVAQEKVYQCSNRWGSFEALARLFTGSLARVEHPECVHRGDRACVYRVAWDPTPEMRWRRDRNRILLLSGVIAPLLVLVTPTLAVPGILALLALDLAVMWWFERRRRLRQAQLVTAGGSSGSQLLAQLNARYEEAQLVQRVGRCISTVTDPHQLVGEVMEALDGSIGFGRAVVLLASSDGSRMVHAGGYGYLGAERILLREVHWELDGEGAPSLVVQAAQDGELQRADTHRRVEGEADELLGPLQLACPLLCEGEFLGVLAAGDFAGGQPDEGAISLLDGIALQLAVGLANARAWVQLQQSERRYRALVENARELEELSRTDDLTGLANRRAFDRALGDEVSRARRHRTPLALVMVDLDWFKSINDRFGHPAGDDVLQEMGRLLSNTARRYDTIARCGGDEFCLLLPQTGREGARLLAERLRAAVSTASVRVEDQEVRLTASVGVAVLEAVAQATPAALVEVADRALYRAKARGRDRVEIEAIDG